MPLASNQQLVKTYGKLPWWRSFAHFRKLVGTPRRDIVVKEKSFSQGPYSFASTQLDLPGDLQAKCRVWILANVDREDLSPLESQDDAFHVTVRYGLHDPDVLEVEAALKGLGPVAVELGRVEQFEAEEYDVLVVPVVEHDGLLALRFALSELPYTDTHVDYRPHVTLAYVRKGKGQKHLGDAGFLGDTLTLDRLRYSASDKQISWISLLPRLYAEKPVELLKNDNGILRRKIEELILEHPDWNREQIKATLKGKGIAQKSEEKFHTQVELSRSLTPYERKVDFAALDSETKKLASQGTDRVRTLLAGSKDKLLSLIASRHKAGTLTSKFVLDLELRGLGQLVPTLRETLGAAFRLGQREAGKELKRTFAQYAEDWDGQEHPREEDGKFAPKGGGKRKDEDDSNQQKLARGTVLYHGTKASVIESIRKHGLLAKQDELWGQGKVVWLTRDRSMAERSAAGNLTKGDSSAVVEIQIPQSELKKIDDKVFVHKGSIPSKYIKKIHVVVKGTKTQGPYWETYADAIATDEEMFYALIIIQESLIKSTLFSKQCVDEIDRRKSKVYQVKLDPTGLPPEKALEFFERKAVLWGADIRQPLLGEVKNILFDGMKQGTPLRELMARIEQAYLPWLGDPDQAIDEAMLTPYRLETLVRTNVTEALNEGRKAQFQEAVDDGFVVGLAYSAVLDVRTTEVCRHLDEKIFPPNSPDLDRLTPPRHHNCRSLVVPLTRMEGPVQYITPAQVAKGIELSGKGFSEESEPRQYEWNEEDHPRVPAGEEGGGRFATSTSSGEDGSDEIESAMANAENDPLDSIKTVGKELDAAIAIEQSGELKLGSLRSEDPLIGVNAISAKGNSFAAALASEMGRWTSSSKREIAAMVDNKTGKVVGPILRGTNDQVRLGRQYLALEKDSDVTHIHTHPSWSSFSSADIKQLGIVPQFRRMLVRSEDGTTYEISRTKETHIPESRLVDRHYREIRDELMPKYYTAEVKRVVELKGDYSLRDPIVKKAWREHSHEIVAELAKQYKFNYVRHEREYAQETFVGDAFKRQRGEYSSVSGAVQERGKAVVHYASGFDESEHPREEDGKFAPKGGGESSGGGGKEEGDKEPLSFGSWGADLNSKDLIGYRAAGPQGQNLGKMAATEGVGPYIAKESSLASQFGKAQRVFFPKPKNPLIVDEEPLHILQETNEVMEPPSSSDSPWLSANKEAVRSAKVTDENWPDKVQSGELAEALTKVLRKRGHDAVLIRSGGEEWTILLAEKGKKIPLRTYQVKLDPTGLPPEKALEFFELSGKGFSQDDESRVYASGFDESDHPREEDGKFAPAGGGSSNAKSEDAIRAVGEGKERVFVNADGSPVDEATQARINALGIPPGWTGVQVSADPESPLQAIGYDKSGKEQPRYSKQWTTASNAAKHLRVAALAQDGYKKMVAGVGRDMAKGVEEAVVMRLVTATAMRIGGESEKAIGATTLEARHLSVEGNLVRFDFPGKSGKRWEGTIRDQDLAEQVSSRLTGKSGTNRVFSTSASKVNAYLKQYGTMSAKDVRTLQGTATAMKELKKLGEPKTLKEAKQHIKIVATKVSEHLRNTPAVAKSSYINPAVWAPIQAKFGIQVVK